MLVSKGGKFVNYLVSYDLRDPGRDYSRLVEAIKAASTGVWCRPLESVFVIRSDRSASEIFDLLSPALDANDHLLVLESGISAHWRLDQKCSDYLQSML